MSDPAGWYTNSVTPNAASPAIFSDTCSTVPVNAIELANAMRSATCGSSRGLALIRCPAWMTRCRSLSGDAGRPAALIARVIQHHRGRPGGVDDPRRGQVLALVEHRAEGQQRPPFGYADRIRLR